MTGGTEMRHRFDNTVIHPESALDQILAVSGNNAGTEINPVAAESTDRDQLFTDDGNRIAAVGRIILVKDLIIFRNQNDFGGCTTAVDPEISVSRIGSDLPALDSCFCVALNTRLIVLFTGKKRF